MNFSLAESGEKSHAMMLFRVFFPIRALKNLNRSQLDRKRLLLLFTEVATPTSEQHANQIPKFRDSLFIFNSQNLPRAWD